MQDADRVQELERQSDFRDVEARRALEEQPLVAQVEEELAALQVVHDEEELAVRLEGRLQPDDERVHHLREDVALRAHVRNVVLPPQEGLRDDLHGVADARVLVPRQENAAKAAAADDLEQLEVSRADGGLRRVAGAARRLQAPELARVLHLPAVALLADDGDAGRGGEALLLHRALRRRAVLRLRIALVDAVVLHLQLRLHRKALPEHAEVLLGDGDLHRPCRSQPRLPRPDERAAGRTPRSKAPLATATAACLRGRCGSGRRTS